MLAQTPDFSKRNEAYFSFTISSKAILPALSKIISLDNVKGNTVYAYANSEEFDNFLKYNLPYKLLTAPSLNKDVSMSGNEKEIKAWDVYPTYDAYVSMMNQFAASHPDICKIVDGGNTVQGRKILFAVITSNVNTPAPKPHFMYSSSIHGDELTGYVNMLRFIDSILTSYGTDARITNLVNNVEIWINPLANPDGTYHSGNTTVSGATRYNANSYDLNRNFPDPATGPNPTGTWQPETIDMMNIFAANHFSLSANLHGGSEVVNYPFDCFERLHPDDSWFIYISRQYADTVHANSPAGYMTDLDNGITNGYAWYYVYGGRQDYMTYFMHGRETTIELSSTKLPSASTLPNYWKYNKKSWFNYLQNCLYGIHGTIRDSMGSFVKAKITVVGHDADSSEVYSSAQFGDFYRFLAPGTYTLKITAPNYTTQTIENIAVTNLQQTVLNITLGRSIPVELTSFNSSVTSNIVKLNWSTATETNNKGFNVERKYANGDWKTVGFVKGNGSTTEISKYSFTDKVDFGKYSYRLQQVDFGGSFEYSKTINVEAVAPKVFSLEQNYPNPFNPSTVIRFNLAADSKVVVKIFNIIGQEVKTLVNNNYSAGQHSVTFNAANLNSGVYFYKMEAKGKDGSSFSSTKKMILTK
jgi:hypothetical protein